MALYDVIPVEVTCPSAGGQSSVTVTAVAQDIPLTSCQIDLPHVFQAKTVVRAWLSVSIDYRNNTNAGANFLAGASAINVSSDDGATYTNRAIGLVNRLYTQSSGNQGYCEISGGDDIASDVVAAIIGGYALKFQLNQIQANAGNLNLYGIELKLHLLIE